MAIIANQSLHQPQHLDFKLVLKGTMFFAAFLLAMAIFNPEPVAFAAGAIVPALCLRIVYTPVMPAAVIYLFVWQWLQIFARLLQAWIDGETLSGGLGGLSVLRAYWYMLASLIVLAIVFRLVLSRMKPPTQAQRMAHYKWTVRDVGMFYALGYVVSMVGAMAGRFSGGLAQPGEVVGYQGRRSLHAVRLLHVDWTRPKTDVGRHPVRDWHGLHGYPLRFPQRLHLPRHRSGGVARAMGILRRHGRPFRPRRARHARIVLDIREDGLPSIRVGRGGVPGHRCAAGGSHGLSGRQGTPCRRYRLRRCRLFSSDPFCLCRNHRLGDRRTGAITDRKSTRL